MIFQLNRSRYNIIMLILFIVNINLYSTSSAQVLSKNNLYQLTSSFDAFRKSHPIEKVYLQFDKTYYSIGDTIWFKAWLFNANYLSPSYKSAIMYVELTNDSDKVVRLFMLPVAAGASCGNITLDEKEFPEGNYTLRAYTNWMRNFDDASIFKKSFFFSNTSKNDWVVNTKVDFVKENGVDKAHLQLKFSQLNKEPLIFKNIQLDVLKGKKELFNRNIETKLDGTADVIIDLKNLTNQATIIAKGLTKNEPGNKLIIPVKFERDVDVQFMPEGGNLVAGLPAYIGFKAISDDGKGIDIEGDLFNSKQQLVTSFKSVHNGIGAFEMTPQTGDSYTAKVTSNNGIVKTFALPPVQNTGTVLKIRSVGNTDSLALTVTSTQNGRYYLIGQSHGLACYEAIITLVENAGKAKLSTSAFPTGIARFTLLNADGVPLNERIVFINHHNNLHIAIRADKLSYKKRDSISLHINVNDTEGNPVKGNFSISVTDNSQVKMDSLNSSNIISNLLLTSDLKGTVENPDYYFQIDSGDIIKRQLDNLLLTQGWVGYDWKNIADPSKQLPYKAETYFNITGKVKNIFNKPLANTQVLLFSKKPPLLIDTVTDKDGRFNFKSIFPVDTPAFIIQARNKNGKSFNVGIEVEEFKLPVFDSYPEKAIPWYVNTDTILMAAMKNKMAAMKETDKQIGGGGKVLKEVVISAKKFIKDSQNPNGAGNADLVIDERELEKAGKKTWLQLLKEKVPGFEEGFMLLAGPPAIEKIREDRIFAAFIVDDISASGFEGINQEWYYINGKPVKFIIDGISLYKIMPISLPAITNINDYLNAHSAEDIKGIEVNSSSKYASRYIPIEWGMLVRQSDIAFVEITTRSGGGPGVGNMPGTYLYKPLAFQVSKQFYNPKYTVKNKDNPIKDYRSTIYWEPNVNTNEDGRATVTFYSNDNAGSYNVTIQGTDWNGNFGVKQAKISIVNP